MVTGILNLLFLICNDFWSIIGPTRVTVSFLDTLLAVGPNRGDFQHGDGAAHSITLGLHELPHKGSIGPEGLINYFHELNSVDVWR